MTLPASGFIRMSMVDVELSLGSTARISLSTSSVRNLAGKASGRISMSDLRGKSSVIVFTMVAGTSPNPDHTGQVYFPGAGLVIGTVTPASVGAIVPVFIDSHHPAGGLWSFAFESQGFLPQNAFSSITISGPGVSRVYYTAVLSGDILAGDPDGNYSQFPADSQYPDRTNWSWFSSDINFIHGQTYTVTLA